VRGAKELADFGEALEWWHHSMQRELFVL